MTFAYFEGEDPEQTAAYIASLLVAIEGTKQRGETDSTKEAEAELARVQGQRRGKQTRAKGAE